jgi:feruloyl-CoA synthase
MPTISNSAAAKAPFRKTAFGPYGSTVERRPDGTTLIRSNTELEPYPRCFTERLVHWANVRPEQTAFAKRDKTGAWKHLRFAELLRRAQAVGQALLDRGLSAERPVVILSENDFEHAVLALACQHTGIAYCAISAGYSLLSTDFGKLRHAIDLLTPGLVFAADGARYGRAIEAVVPKDTEVVLVEGMIKNRPFTAFSVLQETAPTPAVQAAYEAIEPETIAKFLFTSGSTKMPKAVVNTHRMICANPQQYLQTYPDVGNGLVLLDWLPWHHTAAGNNNFGMVIFHGGTMYIDDGKPTPQLMHETIRNLHEIAPTWYCTVPKGLEDLVSALRCDEELGRTFFSKLQLIFPAGAAVPQSLRDGLDEMSVRAVGERIPMTMGLGMTESGPSATSAHVEWWQPGIIGVPNPGVTLKLVPTADKLEVRYKGPNVTPGYWRQPDMTAEAFDEEGFFCSGDAVRFLDDTKPEMGLRFDGRIAEDFKLMSGTWVNVGNLRSQLIAVGAPYVWDVVVTGHDRLEIGALVFLHPAPSRALCDSLTPESTLSEIVSNTRVRAHFQTLLDELSQHSTGSSTRIAVATLLAEPPSFELGEVTDKGSINQRNVLKTRAHLVNALYSETGDERVLRAARRAD